MLKPRMIVVPKALVTRMVLVVLERVISIVAKMVRRVEILAASNVKMKTTLEAVARVATFLEERFLSTVVMRSTTLVAMAAMEKVMVSFDRLGEMKAIRTAVMQVVVMLSSSQLEASWDGTCNPGSSTFTMRFLTMPCAGPTCSIMEMGQTLHAFVRSLEGCLTLPKRKSIVLFFGFLSTSVKCTGRT